MNSAQHKIVNLLKTLWDFGLAGEGQWIEYQPGKRRVAGLIPSQDTCLGCGLGPQWGVRGRQPHIDVSLLLPPSLPLSL